MFSSLYEQKGGWLAQLKINNVILSQNYYITVTSTVKQQTFGDVSCYGIGRKLPRIKYIPSVRLGVALHTAATFNNNKEKKERKRKGKIVTQSNSITKNYEKTAGRKALINRKSICWE